MMKVLVRMTGQLSTAISPVVAWALEDGKVVLVISVPRGNEPIYYASNIPYVRHLSTSRPAEPHEVINAVLTCSANFGPLAT